MATAVLRSHDALANTMHLDAFAASPIKPRRRRHAKAGSPPPKTAVPAVSSSPPKQAQAAVASSPPKAPAAGRRSPPAKPTRKQPSPTKEAPAKPQMVVRILKRGEEPPAPAPVPAPTPVQARAQAPPADRRVRSPSPPSAAPVQVRAQAPPADRRVLSPSPASAPVPARAPADKRVLGFTARIGPQAPAVVPSRKMVSVAANAATYAGPAFSVAAPEPSSLPVPGFLQRAEEEATRGLRCLLRIGELS
ncbi:hypothetical protein ACQ4PT_001380 [Festuca glaucescens]